MTVSLTDYASSLTDYLVPYRQGKVLVYVEGLEDVPFWHSILSRYEKTGEVEFDIQPFAKGRLVDGKKALEKLFGGTSQFLLVCLDSDYDYLLPTHSGLARQINTGPYIFQTYAYSIENLKCYAKSLQGVCVKTTHASAQKIDFPALLKRYSQIIYRLFIWNLYFYHLHDTNAFTVTDFCKVIKIEENPNINEAGEAALNNLAARVTGKLRELEQAYPEHSIKLDAFAQQFAALGLSEDNAYLFIQGHTLYDNVVLMFLKPLCRALKQERLEEIKAGATPKTEKVDKIKHYHNLVGKVDDSVATKLFDNDKFEDCFLFKKIDDDLVKYLQGFGS